MTDVTAFRGRRRRSRQWQTIAHGIQVAMGADPLDGWRLVLPTSGRFAGLTAAALHGWWIPPVPAGVPVFAAVDLTASRPRRAGLLVTRSDPVRPPQERLGHPVDSPLDVLLACARDLAVLDVAVLAAAAVFFKDVGLDELRDDARRVRRRGAPVLREALRWVDGKAESPYEVLLAVLHRSAGVRVEAQFKVYDGNGDFVARADLWVDGTRRLPEYDGGDHLEVAQQRVDLRRVRALNRLGWDRRGYTQHEVLRTPHAILRDADEAVGRVHEPRRLAPYLALLRASAFTPAGQSALLTRLAGRAG